MWSLSDLRGTCNDVPLCRIDLQSMIGTCADCQKKLKGS